MERIQYGSSAPLEVVDLGSVLVEDLVLRLVRDEGSGGPVRGSEV